MMQSLGVSFSDFTPSQSILNSMSPEESFPQKALPVSDSAAGERPALIQAVRREFEQHHQDLIQYSLLEPLAAAIPADLKVSDASLATLCLGPATYETKVGWESADGARYFAALFTHLKNGAGLFTRGNISPDILEACEQIKLFWDNKENLQHKAETTAKAIQSLEPGKSYVLPCGWKVYPTGHCMLMRFERELSNNSCYTLHVYNAQADFDCWVGGRQVGHKQQVRPYMKFAGITEEELFFKTEHSPSNPIILFNLLKLLEFSWHPRNFYTLLSVLAPLRHRLSSQKSRTERFISAQRGNDCVKKSFNCLFLDLSKSKQEFKEIVLDARLFSIIAYYSKIKSNDCADKTFLLLQSSRALLRLLDTNFQAGHVAEKEYLHGVATVSALIRNLNPSHTLPSQLQKDLPADQHFDLLLDNTRSERRRKLKKLRLESEKASPHQICKAVDPQIGKGATWKTLLKQLEEWNKETHLNSKKIVYEVEFLLSNLSHLKTAPLTALMPNEALLALKELKQLTIRYIQSLGSERMYQSCMSQNTVMEILAIAYCLATRADHVNNVLRHFGLHYAYFTEEASLFMYAVQDSAMLDQRNSLCAFFESLPFKETLFNFDTEIYDEEKFFEERMPESRFYGLYRKNLCSDERKRLYLTARDFPDDMQQIECLKVVSGLVCSAFKFESDPQAFREDIERKILLNKVEYTSGQVKWSSSPEKKKSFAGEYGDQAEHKESYFERFLKSQYWQHSTDELPSENKWLLQTAGESDTIVRSSFSALCEPSVEISILFQLLTDQIETLCEKKWRLLFENLFFKTIQETKHQRTVSPLLSEIKNDASLCLRLELLLQESLRTIKQIPFLAENQELFLGFLFTQRLRATLLYLWQQEHPNATLSEKLIEQRQEALARLESLLASESCEGILKVETLVAKVALLKEVPLHQQSQENLAELFLAYCSLLPQLGTAQLAESTIFRRELQRRWLQSLPAWEQFLAKDTARVFVSKVLQRMNGFFGADEIEWLVVKNSTVHFKEKQSQAVWLFDIGNAEIYNADGKWNSAYLDIPSSNAFDRLFHTRKQQMSLFGDCAHFQDPIWGKVRIHLKDYHVERFHEGKWWFYINKDNYGIFTLLFNNALIFDHALWLTQGADKEAQLCDLKSGELRYTIKNSGTIKALETDCEFFESGMNLFPIMGLMGSFEDYNQISFFKGPKGERLIELPRFSTGSGGALHFILNSEHQLFQYSENSSLFIDPQPTTNWGFRCCLNLVSAEGAKRSVLIPVGEITANAFEDLCEINLPNSFLDGNRASLHFFEYEVRGNALYGSSLNAKLYLGTLLLACKQYQQAMNSFKHCSKSDIPDAETWRLFTLLVNSSKNFGDSSVNACAVRLHVYLYLTGINPYLPEIEKLSKTSQGLFEVYLRGIRDVEEPLLLHPEQEIEFIEQLGSDGFSARLHYLKGQSYSLKHSFPSENVQIDQKLMINKGLLPRNILYSWVTDYIEKFNELHTLLKNPDFMAQVAIVTQKSTLSVEWSGFVYDLATRDTRIFSEGYLLFLALLSQNNLNVPLIPPQDSSEKTIKQWWSDVRDVFKKCRCFEEKGALGFEVPNLATNSILQQPSLPMPKTEKSLPKIILKPHLESESQLFFLHTDYLVPVIPDAVSEETLDTCVLELQAPELLPQEEMYRGSIQARFRHYAKEYHLAKAVINQKPEFKEGANLEQLLYALQQEEQLQKNKEEGLEADIVQLANRPPRMGLEFHELQAIRQGYTKSEVSIYSLCHAAVRPEWETLLKEVNRYLSPEELRHLHRALIDFMLVATERKQFRKIIISLSGYLNVGKLNLYLRKKAAQELFQVRSYNPESDLFILLFEYISGQRPRSPQLGIIRFVLPLVLVGSKPELGRAYQLAMNGGKTSLILSLLIELASESGLISCVFSHYSQIASAKGTLQHYQKSRYNKDLYTLEYTLSDLSDVKTLDAIKKRLSEAKNKRCGVIMKSSLPQVIQLKFVLDCLRIESVQHENKSAALQSLKKLAEILMIFETDILSLLDECDLLLSLLYQVNVPFGEEKMVSPVAVELVAAIYRCLIDPEIREKVGLIKNLQAELTEEAIKLELVPFIAKKMFGYQGFSLKSYPHLRGAFERYLKDAIPFTDQELADDLNRALDTIDDTLQRENVTFLRLFELRSRSDDRYEKESAELMGTMRLINASVLSVALSKTFNRNYGINPNNLKGSIIPYQGPDSPAITRFGFVYLSLSLHLQAAIGGGIQAEELTFLAEQMLLAARAFAPKDRVNLLDTLEAKQFFQMTGIQLTEVSDPLKVQTALNFVNAAEFPERRLKVRQEIAPFHVKYHPNYLVSHPLNLLSHLARPVAGSGDVYNSSSYHPKVGTVKLDEGSEGLVMRTIIDRDTLEPSLHQVASKSLKGILEVIKKHPHKQRVRGIIDTGGFLTESGTKDANALSGSMAGTLLDFLVNEPGIEIEGVIFVHRYSPKEVARGMPEETFMVLKKGYKTHLLSNTTLEEIQKCGIPLNKLFFVWDELRATGTDATFLKKNSFFLQTIDPKMPVRTLRQGTLRARGFFEQQRVEYLMLKPPESMKVVIDQLIKNEGVLIGDQTLRYYELQMPNISRTGVVRELCQAALERNYIAIKTVVNRHLSLLVSTYKEQHWQQHGRIQPAVSTYKYLEEQAAPFLKKLTYEESLEAKELLNAAKVDPLLQSTVVSSHCSLLDSQVELVQEKEVELDFENDVTLQDELQQELKTYSEIACNGDYQERVWNLAVRGGQLLLNDVLEGCASLEDSCREIHRYGAKTVSLSQYAPCFSRHVWMTTNLKYTYTNTTPLLHPDAKLPDFVLMITAENQLHSIFMSKKDAAYFKQLFGAESPKNAWLVNLKGLSEGRLVGELLTKKRAQPEFESQFQQGLWYTNLFAGNVSHLEESRELSAQIIGNNKKLFGRFLLLRNAGHAKKLQQTARCSLIDAQAMILKGGSGLLFSSRREWMRKRYVDFQSMNQDRVADIDPDQVIHLGPHQIPWLTTKEQVLGLRDEDVNCLVTEQIALLDDSQVEFLTKPELIAALPPGKVALLSKDQIYHLKNKQQIRAIKDDSMLNHIHPECVRFVAPDRIQHIDVPDLIAVLPPKCVPMIVSTQARHLVTPEQLKKVPDPFVNALDPSQIENLPDPKLLLLEKAELIAVVAPGKVGLMQASQVPEFVEDQIAVLPVERPDLIQSVPLDKVCYLKPEHVPFVLDTQVPHLYAANLVAAIPPNRVPLIASPQARHLKTPEQLENLPDPFVNALDPSQIENLPDLKLPLLEKAELIAVVAPGKVGLMQASQVPEFIEGQIAALPVERSDLIQNVPLDKVCYLKPEHVPFVLDTQVPKLEGKQVDAIKLDHFDLLDNKQLKEVRRKELVEKIPVDKIPEVVVPEQISHLTPAQVAKVPNDLADLVGETQVADLQEEQIPYLQKPNLIKKVPGDKVPFLAKKEQVECLDPDQVPCITPEQVPHLKTQAQIEAIPATAEPLIQKIPLDRVSDTHPGQVPCFTAAQVGAIAKEAHAWIQNISADKLESINEGHLPSLTEPQIKALPDRFVNQVTRAQVPWLRSDHVKLLKSPPLIQQIPAPLLSHLAKNQVPNLTDEQIKLLPADRDLVIEIPKHRHRELTEAQFRLLFAPKGKGERCANIIKGIVLSILGIGIALPFWLAINCIWLTVLTLGAIVIPKARRAWTRQVKETFVANPIRQLILVMIVYDYLGYRKLKLRWTP